MNEDFIWNFPFQKVNKEKRIVTGIATAENVDHSREIVDFNGSLEAFNNWMGNIREMHGKEAVGKAVAYRPVTVWYKGSQYRGIEVDAYISKGAPNTWEKVCDGTLAGFSVGGYTIEKRKEFNKSIGDEVTRIIKYFLGELSLVDNPDNPTAKLSLIKMKSDGTLAVETEDDVIEKATYNIYYCEEHQIAKADSRECSSCAEPMKDIGSINEFDIDLITKMVADQKGEQMQIDLEKSVEVASEEEVIVETEEVKDDETINKSLQNNEVADTVNNMELSADQKVTMTSKFMKWLGFSDEENVIEKAVTTKETEVKEEATEVIEKSVEVAAEEVVDNKNDGGSELNIEDFAALLDTKLDEKLNKFRGEITEEIDNKVNEISKSVDVVTEKVEGVSTKVETIDEKTAVKKSVDAVDEIADNKIEKSVSFWGGSFVDPQVCEVLGYDS
jgi:hypothetical protein